MSPLDRDPRGALAVTVPEWHAAPWPCGHDDPVWRGALAQSCAVCGEERRAPARERLSAGHHYGIMWALRMGLAEWHEDTQHMHIGGDGFREIKTERLIAWIADACTVRPVCVLLNGEIRSPEARAILDEWDASQLAEARALWERRCAPLA